MQAFIHVCYVMEVVPEIRIPGIGWLVWFAHGQVQQLLATTSIRISASINRWMKRKNK